MAPFILYLMKDCFTFDEKKVTTLWKLPFLLI